VVLVIVGLLFVFLIPVSNTLRSNQRRAATEQKLQNLQAAINNFVVLHRRLPCPADGTPGTYPTGVEAINASGICTDNAGVPNGQAYGVVPWVSLALTPADAQDAWYNEITYRVGYGLTQAGALDMSYCDPAGTATTNPAPTPPNISLGLCLCSPTQPGYPCPTTFNPGLYTLPSNFVAYKGLDVYDGPNTDPTKQVMNYTNGTGAAYILISHGDNGLGAINIASNGKAVSVTSPANGVSGTLEAANFNSNSPALLVTSGPPPRYIDAPFSDTPDNPPTNYYFDDIIIRPSLLSVIYQAGLGARAH